MAIQSEYWLPGRRFQTLAPVSLSTVWVMLTLIVGTVIRTRPMGAFGAARAPQIRTTRKERNARPFALEYCIYPLGPLREETPWILVITMETGAAIGEAPTQPGRLEALAG